MRVAEPRELHALGRLIRDVQQANGWSYADIAGNAGRGGRNLSRSRVESIRNDPLTSIGIKAITALAAGLDVPADRVAFAALESMGYPPPAAGDQHSAVEAIERDPELSATARRIVLAALAAARDDHRSAAAPHRSRHDIVDIAADSD
jgi:transcriptional regulator with XRE-family HTH domain